MEGETGVPLSRLLATQLDEITGGSTFTSLYPAHISPALSSFHHVTQFSLLWRRPK